MVLVRENAVGDRRSRDVLRYQCIVGRLKVDCGAQQQIALSENGVRIRPSSTEGRENSVVSRRVVKSRCHAFSVNEDGSELKDATFMATRIGAQTCCGQVARMIFSILVSAAFFAFCDERWRRPG